MLLQYKSNHVKISLTALKYNCLETGSELQKGNQSITAPIPANELPILIILQEP